MTTNPLSLHQVKNPLIKYLVQSLSRLHVIEKWYDRWTSDYGTTVADAGTFAGGVLDWLNIETQIVNAGKLDAIPTEGPLIVVANHPLGGIEGMQLTQLLMEKRPDLKVLTNELLASFPEFQNTFIGVDVLGSGRVGYNARSLRRVARHLDTGGALLVFPAGTVSVMPFPSLKIEDAPWTPMIARLAEKYGAAVQPVYVDGKNPKWFYMAGWIHKRLRTLLLPRVMLAMANQKIGLRFGDLISAKDIRRLGNATIVTDFMRLCCKVLRVPQTPADSSEQILMETISADLDRDDIAAYVAELEEFSLYKKGNYALYCVPYSRMGPMMTQLSIERERTFRAADEGTGKELDSDQFDPHYMHLFIWDHSASKIVGGYRMGKTDEIAKARGLAGLYSHSLFDYNQSFLKRMDRSIEVGRSFVTADYQRNPTALDLLWKGIGRYVAANSEYHTLFGCVSISRQYSKLASAMLTETFIQNYGVDPDLADGIKARIPLDNIDTPWTSEQLASLSEIPIINKLVGRIDNGKSIPILIRQYLALNGRFVSFTVNDQFNNSMDGLILVDLRNTPKKYLKRYMGDTGLATFTDRWDLEDEMPG